MLEISIAEVWWRKLDFERIRIYKPCVQLLVIIVLFLISFYSLAIFIKQWFLNILLVNLHYYFIHKYRNFLNFWKTLIRRFDFILLQLLINLLVNILLGGLTILLMRLVNWNNFVILVKIISWDQTVVDYSCWLVAVHSQLKYLVCVCITVSTAELIRCWLCISIVG
jgi:sterol desaturase/sphingolipid hydroxylase (fatty acid hydroxylase superfamily)